MADIRINALATTAASTASDDFVAVDGSANGTRKLNAYSPTFGGNLTVSGGTARFQDPTNSYGVTITTAAAKTLVETLFGGSSLGIRVGGSGSDSLTIASTGATIRDNLTVSGTGTSSVAGNFGIGTTTPDPSSLGGRVLTLSGDFTRARLQLRNTDSTSVGSAAGTLQWMAGSTSLATIDVASETAANTAYLAFSTSASGTIAEAMRISATNRNLLLGTTTDSGNGKLQLADHNNSAGGIGFGTDVSLYRYSTNGLKLANTGSTSALYLTNNGATTPAFGIQLTSATAYLFNEANGSIIFGTNNTTALTLDSSQNATFANEIRGTSNLVAVATSATNGNIYLRGKGTGYVRVDTGSGFRVEAGKVSFTSLPTSSAGLSAGDIWNDAGTLKIV